MDAQLVDRLSRLEKIIKQLEPQRETNVEASSQADSCPSSSPRGHAPSAESCHSADSDDAPRTNVSIGQHTGWLMVDDTKSHYVSDTLWAKLGNEIGELRNMLHEPPSEDEHDQILDFGSDDDLSPSSTTALLGYRSLAHSLRHLHPPLPVSVALSQAFSENVVPLVRIFHMPTTARIYWDAVSSLDTIDHNTEALLFAIYYCAIMSLSPERCLSLAGTSRDALLRKYRFATEQALARADLLNTQSLILLQAAVLFITALREEDGTRTPWSLTALIYHIAQSMGLHRDGAAFRLKPLEIELRRRLWHHIRFLDIHAEFHGYEPIIPPGEGTGGDTRFPLNINDGDLTGDMTEPPPEREGATEMTFCLIRCESIRVGSRIGLLRPSADGSSFNERLALVQALRQRLQDKYLRHCVNSDDPFLLLVATVTELITTKTWLMMHYPLCQKRSRNNSNPYNNQSNTNSEPSPNRSAGVVLDNDLRDQIFTVATKVLDIYARILTDPKFARWVWHSRNCLQWHAVALVLSEICARPPSDECDRAWGLVCTVFEVWQHCEDSGDGVVRRRKRGSSGGGEDWMLARSQGIRRLMAKARYVREVQKGTGKPGTQEGLTPASSEYLSANSAPSCLSSDGSFQSAADEFPQSLPEILQGGWFDSLPDLPDFDNFAMGAVFQDWSFGPAADGGIYHAS